MTINDYLVVTATKIDLYTVQLPTIAWGVRGVGTHKKGYSDGSLNTAVPAQS